MPFKCRDTPLCSPSQIEGCWDTAASHHLMWGLTGCHDTRDYMGSSPINICLAKPKEMLGAPSDWGQSS